MNGLPPELLAGFLTEARGYLESLRRAFASFQADSDQNHLRQMHEQAAILSGGAEMLELTAVSEWAAQLVTLLDAALVADSPLGAGDQARVTTILDEIAADLDAHEQIPVPEPARADHASPRQAGPLVSSSNGSGTLADTLADLPPDLLAIFALEVSEHLASLESGLERLRQHPGDTESLREMRRVTHTLKGASASVGLMHMARLAHVMEELFEGTLTRGEPLAEDAFDLLFDSTDTLSALIDPEQPAEKIEHTLGNLHQAYIAVLGDAYPYLEELDTNAAPTPPIPADQPADLPDSPDATGNGDSAVPHPARAEDMLRLSLADMDDLINRVGEIIINRAGLERSHGALRTLLAELDYAMRRLRQAARGIDAHIDVTVPAGLDTADSTFDPIELDRYSRLYQLARELEEIAADTGDIHKQLMFVSGDLDGGLTRERRLTTDVQDKLLAARLVPFVELETRLRRTVHRTARDVGKQAAITLRGFEITVDKKILDALADPLMHLIRNAVDHGIETPAQREAAGKPSEGQITLGIERQRGRVLITLADDGAGIDTERIRARAAAAGLIDPGAQLAQSQLFDLLFREGFSLADTVTQTSGRGIGLDIVARAVNRLQGTIRLESTPGAGTTFTIAVPVTLAITRALFFRSVDQEFAVPLEQVSAVLRLEDADCSDLRSDNAIRYEGRALPVFDLAVFVTGPGAETVNPRYGLVIPLAGRSSEEIMVLIERLGGIHEAVVKSLGSHLRRVDGVIGATIAGDGGVTLILDLLDIVAGEQSGVSSVPLVTDRPAPHVLVVDDSPSVRRVVSAFLERSGWKVTTAKDGIDALDHLAHIRPDVALVDIEMPRMNGYELLARIKTDPDLDAIPVVFLTSRSAAKHRDRAAQIGADGYLVKPYREGDLLAELMRVMQR